MTTTAEPEKPKTKRCRRGLHDIPIGAGKCIECDEYQDWRRWGTTVALISGITGMVLGILNFVWPRIEKLLPAQTSIDSISADDTYLHVTVSNTGGRASILTGTYQLRFPPELAGAPVALELPGNKKGETTIEPMHSITLDLTVREFELLKADKTVYTKQELADLIRRQPQLPVSLEIAVRGSNGKSPPPRSTTLGEISDFVRGRASGGGI